MKGVLRMRQSLTVRRAEHFDINRKIIANMTAQSWHDIPMSLLQTSLRRPNF